MGKFSLSIFKNEIKDVARPYHFEVQFQGGAFAGLSGKERVFIRSASIPSYTMGQNPIDYFGMQWKIAGAPQFTEMSCEFIIDAEYSILKSYMAALNGMANITSDGEGKWQSPENYQGNVKLKGLNTSKSPVYDVDLKMAYLSNIGDIQFNHTSKDTPLVFQAQLVYSYYEI